MNNGTIPSISPVAALRGGVPLQPEKSVNYTAGVAFDTGPFNYTADYFRINVSDRIGITSNFNLTDAEIDGLLAEGVDAARDLRTFRFFGVDGELLGGRLRPACLARRLLGQR